MKFRLLSFLQNNVKHYLFSEFTCLSCMWFYLIIFPSYVRVDKRKNARQSSSWFFLLTNRKVNVSVVLSGDIRVILPACHPIISNCGVIELSSLKLNLRGTAPVSAERGRLLLYLLRTSLKSKRCHSCDRFCGRYKNYLHESAVPKQASEYNAARPACKWMDGRAFKIIARRCNHDSRSFIYSNPITWPARYIYWPAASVRMRWKKERWEGYNRVSARVI